jgi:hypothetical protein
MLRKKSQKVENMEEDKEREKTKKCETKRGN